MSWIDISEGIIYPAYFLEVVTVSGKKYKTLAIYDVVETKRRNKLVKCLQHYLIRIQKSAFEGDITPKQCKTLAKNAGSIIDPQEDLLRIYVIYDVGKLYDWGKRKAQPEEVIIV